MCICDPTDLINFFFSNKCCRKSNILICGVLFFFVVFIKLAINLLIHRATLSRLI